MTSRKDHVDHSKSAKNGSVPRAQSAGGEPDSRPTPVHHAPRVAPEDEPKGQPNSDRFKTEQAARPAERKG